LKLIKWLEFRYITVKCNICVIVIHSVDGANPRIEDG